MIPAVPFILRGALALVVMFLALVLAAVVECLDRLAQWLVPEAGPVPMPKWWRKL